MLLSAAATAVLGDRLSASGDLKLPVSLLSAAGTVLLGLLSYLVILWRRDLKRARVKFAHETGRQICPCSDTGEIMLHVMVTQEGATGSIPAIKCPRCKDWHIYDPAA